MSLSATAKTSVPTLPEFWAGRYRSCGILVVITLLTLAVRLPFRHLIDDDEAFYSLIGLRWLKGALPYVASYDVKPPLLFAIFAFAQAVFGTSLATIKGLEIAFTIWGAVSLQRLIEKQGAFSVSLWAGGLFPFLSLSQAGTDSANSLILIPFVISSFSALSDAMRSRSFPWQSMSLCGLFIGLAGLVKQIALFEAIGLACFAAWHFRQNKPFQTLACFIAGASLPILGFAAYFALAGHLSDAFNAVVAGALARGSLRISAMDDSGLFWIVHFILLVSPLTPLVMASLMAVMKREAILNAFPAQLFNLASVWAICASLGCLAGHSALRYYGSSLIAPLLILSGAYVLYLARGRGAQSLLIIAGSVLATFVCVLWVEKDGLGLTEQTPSDDYKAAQATAVKLSQLGYTDQDALLVPRRGEYVFVETKTVPKFRYFHTMHLLCDFPLPVKSPLISELASRPKFIVMSEPVLPLNCENPEYQKLISATLKDDYSLAGVVQGQWGKSLIYRVNPLGSR